MTKKVDGDEKRGWWHVSGVAAVRDVRHLWRRCGHCP